MKTYNAMPLTLGQKGERKAGARKDAAVWRCLKHKKSNIREFIARPLFCVRAFIVEKQNSSYVCRPSLHNRNPSVITRRIIFILRAMNDIPFPRARRRKSLASNLFLFFVNKHMCEFVSVMTPDIYMHNILHNTLTL